MSFIHCLAENKLKVAFWNDLAQLGDRFSGPWVILRDYNVMLDKAKKRGGRLVGNSSTNGLYNLVFGYGLVDLGYVRPSFTWCNGRRDARCIKERLDKGYATTNRSALFPCALVHHLPRTSSDHCPIMLSNQCNVFNGPKPFRFE